MAGFDPNKKKGKPENVVDLAAERAKKDALDILRETKAETRSFSNFMETTDELVHEIIGREMRQNLDYELTVQEKLFKITKGDVSMVTEATIRHVYKQMENGML